MAQLAYEYRLAVYLGANLMASEHKEQIQIVRDGDYEQRRRVVEHSPSGRNVFVSRLNQFIWLLTTAITALIGFRFLLKLAAANPSNAFANFVYNLSSWLVYPFQTLLGNPTMDSGSVLEITSLLAIFVYLVLAALLTTLIGILLVDKSGIRKVTTVERS
jgi:uncharacterized protein YggT (Ycf19 family)